MEKKSIYKVKFRESEKDETQEALVREVYPSEIPGLVTLSDFVFKDHSKTIILPEEEAASKRFKKTRSIHIPYHNIIFVEELEEEETDLKNLSFLCEVPNSHNEGPHV